MKFDSILLELGCNFYQGKWSVDISHDEISTLPFSLTLFDPQSLVFLLHFHFSAYIDISHLSVNKLSSSRPSLAHKCSQYGARTIDREAPPLFSSCCPKVRIGNHLPTVMHVNEGNSLHTSFWEQKFNFR